MGRLYLALLVLSADHVHWAGGFLAAQELHTGRTPSHFLFVCLHLSQANATLRFRCNMG